MRDTLSQDLSMVMEFIFFQKTKILIGVIIQYQSNMRAFLIMVNFMVKAFSLMKTKHLMKGSGKMGIFNMRRNLLHPV